MFEGIVLIALVVLALNWRSRLRVMDQRLARLEAALAAGATGPAVSAVSAPPAPDPASAPEPDAPMEPPAEPPADTVPPITAPAAGVRTRSLEERFGTQWVVWVGGLALALGGIFLVRYSIEQDLIGPGVRVVLAAVFAAALIAAGEWTRRSERIARVTAISSAHVPGMLTAAGTIVAYADVYAAYALYDIIAPAIAFVLLGLVALATLAAALLHGPALAGLGLAGAYVAPALVATGSPDYWALYLYLAVVTAAAFALARLRVWLWLALVAVGFGFLWSLPGLDIPGVEQLGAHVFHAMAGFALAAAALVGGFLFGPRPQPARIDPVSCVALAAPVGAAMLIAVASNHDPVALGGFTLLTAATVAVAWRAEAATAAVPAAGLFTLLVFVSWALSPLTASSIAASGPTAGAIPEPPQSDVVLHLGLGVAFAALFGGAGFGVQGRSASARIPLYWSTAAVAVPLALLAALYYRVARFELSIPFALGALALAAAFGYATETLVKREPRPGAAAAEAIFATGCVAALALALTMALERGWLTIALALMTPGIALVAGKRPLPALRWLAAAIAVLVAARVAFDPRIVGDDLGATLLFNWLLYGYGVPAAAFWLAGYMMRRRSDDVPVRMVESAALLFTVLLVTMQIRHVVYAGAVYRASSGLTEVALHVCAGLAMTIGLERIRMRSGSIVHDIGALVIAALTLAALVFGLGLFQNPFLVGTGVGGPVVNLILLGYGIPAALAGALAYLTRGHRPPAYGATAAIVAVALALTYLTLQVSRFYQGPALDGPMTDAEQYTHSAVWLAFGIALLAAGFAMRSMPLRYASAAVVAITVAKVFLIDMSGLTGIYRALSFIGLGLVLMAIGVVYQRLLFPRATSAD